MRTAIGPIGPQTQTNMSDCIFCRIAAGEIPVRLVYQDEQITAFHDANPQAPVHILVIPNEHIPSLAHAQEADPDLLAHLLSSVAMIAAAQDTDDGYRVVTNVGKSAGQSVNHLHFHILGGRDMDWPPG